MSKSVLKFQKQESKIIVVRFNLRLTKQQNIKLSQLFELVREVYNAALEERIGAWKWEKRSVSKYDQHKQLTGVKWDYGIQPLRGSLIRLDRSFRGFYKRIKQNQRPGFPRFKSLKRWNSIEYPDSQSWKVNNGKLYLQGIGNIKITNKNKTLPGVPKTLVIKKHKNRYIASITCGVEAKPYLPKTNKSVGIDVGVINLATTSDGDYISNERFRRQSANKLTKVQRKQAKCKLRSRRWKEINKQVVNIKLKEKNQRHNYLHHVSKQIVQNYDFIALEDIKIQQMLSSRAHKLNDAINDSGWGILKQMIIYKAEEAGREVVFVKPYFTSQTCASCGYCDEKNRIDQSTFLCLRCDHKENADINAAQNILTSGQEARFGERLEKV